MPQRYYKAPSAPSAKDSVYTLSYMHPGTDADTAAQCRGKSMRRPDNLSLEGDMCFETTYSSSYQPFGNCRPAESYGSAYKLYYFGNDAESAAQCRQKSLRRPDNLPLEGDMSFETTYSASYQPSGNCKPAESYKPQRCYKALSTPFAKYSVYTLRYMHPGTNADTAAQCRGKSLRRPDNLSLEGDMNFGTTYSASYQPIENNRPAESCKPQRCYKAPSTPFAKYSVYTLGYMHPGTDTDTAAQCRRKSLRRPDNLSLEGNMCFETTYTASYQSSGNCRPAECCKPQTYYKAPSTPFAKDSVYTLSYIHPGTDADTTALCRRKSLRRPDNLSLEGNMCFETTYTASYQPFGNCISAESCKPQRFYKAPSTSFAKDSVYTISYMPPGEFV
ncbi:uncharacterized protein LOC111870227, partial [Cryptotermes secundus]|uniref:uncharacterized protein LOC111870227 n=1 Tax=Cryptotermes secundus TaxID=105785 RepID=UPI000CD7D248